MTDEDTSPAMPAQPVLPESRPRGPTWAPLLEIIVAGLGVAAFAVGLPPITYDPRPMTCTDDGVCTDVTGDGLIECGSVFVPNFVTMSDRGECARALQARRITEGLVTAGVILLALLGAKKSRSVGHKHTRAWDAFLAGGVFAAFLAVGTLAAAVLAYLSAWEQS